MTTIIKEMRDSNARLVIYANSKYEKDEPSRIDERKIKGFAVLAMSNEEANEKGLAIDVDGEYLVVYDSNGETWFRNSCVDLFRVPSRR